MKPLLITLLAICLIGCATKQPVEPLTPPPIKPTLNTVLALLPVADYAVADLQAKGVMSRADARLAEKWLADVQAGLERAIAAPDDREAVLAVLQTAVEARPLQTWLKAHRGDNRALALLSATTAIEVAARLLIQQ